jgi:hypothetical protein
VTENETKGGERMSGQLREHAFKLLGIAVVVMLAIGTVVYHFLEDWGWVDSFYFSSVAVTTVGFGDLAPSRDASKLFTVAYVFSGIALITTYVNERFRRLPGRVAHRRGRSE